VSSFGSSSAKEAWLRAAEERGRMMAPATERMFALAGVVEGARVLDIGTGTGDVALLAAVRVGPKGSVLGVDVSPMMIEGALAAVRAADLPQVEVRVADAQAMDLPAGSVDAALARNLLMFVDDLHKTLSGVRRTLRTGGRFAACTWAGFENNPFNGIVVDVVRKKRPVLEPSLELMRAFSLNDPDQLLRAFADAGFADLVVERVPCVRGFQRVAAAMAQIREIPMYSDLFKPLSDEDRLAMLDEIEERYGPFVQSDGSARFPAESLVIAGTAP
jgi:ubiquinone/menaquinone biosynthesis C-methylase UbiE